MKIKPMLAASLDGELKHFPYYGSPKVDGIRALVIDGKVYSRTMKEIPNQQVQRMFGRLHGLDGELTVGPAHKTYEDDDVYARSRGIIMTKGEIPEADIRFYVFDRWDEPSAPFRHRIGPWWNVSSEEELGIYHVEHEILCDQNEVDLFMFEALATGYEGICLRRADGHYKYGRSTFKEGLLVKMKTFEDGESVILDVVERMTNTNTAYKDELGYQKRSTAKDGKIPSGTLGSFLVRDLTTNVEFNIGTGEGLNDALRAELWANRHNLIGRIVRYRYQVYGTDKAPRLPLFNGFRDSIDIGEVA